MWTGVYYSTDSQFQLELNLQSIRRSLIQLIEEFEAQDCSHCQILKCRCPPTVATPPRSTASIRDVEIQSPPATALPHPEFDRTHESPTNLKDIEAWVRASTPNPEKTMSPGCRDFYASHQDRELVNFSWPPAPRSVWNEYKERINTPEINTATVSQANSVQDFFNAFSVMNSSRMTEQILARNQALMQKLKLLAGQSPEYTYF